MKVLPDSEIRKRLAQEELVFLTQDAEFEAMPVDYRAAVIISRVSQNLPLKQRVEIWSKALQEFAVRRPDGKLFDLLKTGEIIPWGIHES